MAIEKSYALKQTEAKVTRLTAELTQAKERVKTLKQKEKETRGKVTNTKKTASKAPRTRKATKSK